MTDQKTKQSAVKFHEVPHALRKKIGTGGIEPERLARAEAALDNHQIDFKPILQTYIEQLDKELAALKNNNKALNPLRTVVMNIKANGGTFGYRLTGELATVVLEFLETVEELDMDGLRIMQEFKKTLEVIVSHDLSGDGGNTGQMLAKEFYAVCDRYIRRHS